LKKHQEVTVHHRAKLVDVLVDLQEQFFLNHETLYLGAKLFDMFMDKVKTVRPDKLRIVGSVALFLASKFHVC
jgi:cyclin B